jgi:diguanylate cyclase (GGDEF)-like protein
MNAAATPRATAPDQELRALMQTLLDTSERLEELTGGEVDTVADADGHTLVLRKAQDRWRHSQASRQAAILDALPAHVALLDAQGWIISVNEAWRRFARENALPGLSACVGMNYLAVCDNTTGADAPIAQRVASGIRSVIAGEAPSFLAEYPCHSPTLQRWFMMMATPLVEDRSTGAVVMHLDISVRQRALDELEYLDYYDALTGLANRKLFLERVGQYVRTAALDGSTPAVVLLDLERFKNINDTLGRAAGDELLRQVAQWLTQQVGEAALLGRLEADHFAVVLPKPEGNLGRLMEQSTAAFLAHTFTLSGATYRFAVRAGVSLFPADGGDAETLFTHAEAALKRAKAGARRYLFYNQAMTATVAHQMALENQLRQALERQEFVLHYQPKVALASGKLAGAEALLRWNHPTAGLMPPGQFIGLLEETGLIHAVGRWALGQTLADYLAWRAQGRPVVRISVNVSALQLRAAGFAEEVQLLLSRDPRAHEGLELEITESLIMEDVKLSIATLRDIRIAGVTIAIDDFGTGYSSLSYLARLPVDTLKIDRAFVTAMTEGPEALAVVKTIIRLAHSLKMAVVAEGVETELQADLLRHLHCEEMQGFLVSKPLPAEQFAARYLPLPAPEPAQPLAI